MPQKTARGLLATLFLSCLLAAGAAAAEPPALPETPAARAFSDWLTMFNLGDETKVVAFLAERLSPDLLSRLPMEALKAFHVQTYADAGKLQVQAVQESSPERLRVLAKGEKGKELVVTLAVEAAEPHRISALRLVPPSEEKPVAAPPAAKP